MGCTKFIFLPWIILTLFVASPARGQFDLFEAPNKELERQQRPDNTLRDLRQEEERRRLRELRPDFNRKRSLKDRKKQQSAGGPRFLVKRIVVNRSDSSKGRDISEVVKKYEGKYLNVSELQQIVGDLNNLYKDKKGGLSRAVLPPQKIKNGVVKIIIVESKIGDIIFNGTEYTSLNYLRWALPVKKDKDTNLEELEKVFIRFNRTHKGIFVTSSLKAGSEFSETDIVINTNESKRWGLGFSVDNEGSESTGHMRYGITGQNSSLFGIDDPLIVGSNWATGQSSTFVSYEFPFTSSSSRFKALYSQSEQNIVGGSFSELDVEGKTNYISGRVSHPLYVNKLWKIILSGEIAYNVGENKLSIFDLETITRKYRSKIEVNKQDTNGAWIFNIAFSQAMTRNSLNGTTTAREVYQKWTGRISRHQRLNRDVSLVGKLSGQYSADHFLPTSERFSIGGINNLSYESAEFSGDEGYVAELELQYNAGWERYMPAILQPSSLRLFTSLQSGTTTLYQTDGTEISNKSGITSFALGIRSQITKRFNLDLIGTTPINHGGHRDHDARYFLFKFKTIF